MPLMYFAVPRSREIGNLPCKMGRPLLWRAVAFSMSVWFVLWFRGRPESPHAHVEVSHASPIESVSACARRDPAMSNCTPADLNGQIGEVSGELLREPLHRDGRQ
jgi:hypothetical protein